MIPILLAISLPDNPGLLDNLRYQATGMAIVMTALGGLWLIVELMGFFFKAREAARLRADAAALIPAPQPEVAPAIDPLVLALITAAVHATYGHSHRMISVKPIVGLTDFQIWSVEGRREVFASHRTR